MTATPALLRRPVEPAADDTASLLRELIGQVAELRGVIAPDLALRAAVLQALRGEFGAAAFIAMDALEAAAEKPEGDLAQALIPLLGSPVGGLRRLARRMAKLVGKPAGGLVLTRIGDDRGAALYVVQTVQWPGLGRPEL